MRKTKFKICGITQLNEIYDANQYLPDYVGFVFAQGRHKITTESASLFRKMLNQNIQTVGVFVNEDIKQIRKIADQGIINLIQLHGQEDEQYIHELRGMCDKKIIKAFSVMSINDIKIAEKTSADYILYDYEKGGSGQKFNWHLLKGCKRDYFLAGGINYQNIDTALKMKPFAIDISTGAETNGIKDKNKIDWLLGGKNENNYI